MISMDFKANLLRGLLLTDSDVQTELIYCTNIMFTKIIVRAVIYSYLDYRGKEVASKCVIIASTISLNQ